VKVRKGNNAGRFFSIQFNTDNTVMADNGGTLISSLVSVGDLVNIFPGQTLGSLFGTTSVTFLTGSNAAAVDEVRVNTGTQWLTFYNDGANWHRSDIPDVQNNYVIRPDQGLFIIANDQSAVNLLVYGLVGTGRERSQIPASGSALIANRFPIGTTLANLNLSLLTGWTNGDAASISYDVMLWNGAS
jgi:uncharacterized protein (TIGR02597 family)